MLTQVVAVTLGLTPTWQHATPDVDLTPWPGNQIWADCYGGDDGRLWVVWSTFGEVYAQARSIEALTPLTGLVHVNLTTHLQQDEPQVVRLADGRVVIAWSDRSSQWTQYMSVQFAVLAADGTLLVPETPLWSLPASAETSWAPLLDATRAGGFIAAWTGGWGEDSFGRVFGPDLVATGPEFLLNPIDPAKHDSPDLCELQDGGLVAAHMDGAVAHPKDITVSWLSPAGAPTGVADTTTQAGQQWFPKLAADRDGDVVCVWDGTDQEDVFLRRWDAAGTPLGPVTKLASGPSTQRDPEVEMSSDSGGLVVWEDRGANAIVAQSLDDHGRPEGAPFHANHHPLGAQFPGEIGRRVPDVWISKDGRTAIVSWSSASLSAANQDAWAAVFRR